MKWLDKLRNKPYKTRVRYLWIGVGITALIILIIWIITLNLRASSVESLEQYSKFREVWENLKSIDFKF